MKFVLKIVLVVLMIGFVSCRDTKKEEEEANAAIEQIEATEAEVEAISADLKENEKELNEALKDLDSI